MPHRSQETEIVPVLFRISKLGDGLVPLDNDSFLRERCSQLYRHLSSVDESCARVGPITLQQHFNLHGTLLCHDLIIRQHQEQFVIGLTPRHFGPGPASWTRGQRHHGLEIITMHLLERLQQYAR